MSTGINQDIEILGKVFHLQTQVCSTPQSGIRTEVFIGGKLVATRDAALETTPAAEATDAEVRWKLKEHHQKILKSIVERANRYRKRQPEKVKQTLREEDDPEPMTGPIPTKPTSNVDIALRVRRILERFRSRLGVELASIETSTEHKLERAAKGFAWVLQSPDFGDTRIDEQVRFNLLNDQIDEWLGGPRNAEQGTNIWGEVLSFNKYLTGINDRADLAAFDRDLLRWVLRKIEKSGVSERLERHLEMVRGRDVALDRLLDNPASLGPEVWLAHLRRILDDLEAPAF
jgi:hypothetical protein